jgi:exodeoxyribonuclease VIII
MIVHISLDIETFSSRGDASIASIGAYAFTLHKTDMGIGFPDAFSNQPTFYTVVNDPDGHFNPETIRWHAKQENPVITTGGNMPAQSLPKAIRHLTHWLNTLRRYEKVEGKHDLLIWSHATFDAPIISLAAARCGEPNPWGYRDARDLRTLYQIAGGRPDPTERTRHLELVPHSALDDAIWQAWEIAMCFEQISQLHGEAICAAF